MTPNQHKMLTIARIVDRTEALYQRLDLPMPTDRFSLIMDIDYTDQIIPLDLQALLEYDDSDFAHDVGGIIRHFNRVTREMDDCFTPRCADTVQYHLGGLEQ